MTDAGPTMPDDDLLRLIALDTEDLAILSAISPTVPFVETGDAL